MTLKFEIDRRVGMLPKLMSESNTGKYHSIASRMLTAYVRGQAAFPDGLLNEIVTAVKEEETHDRITRRLKANIEKELYKIGYELSYRELTDICRKTIEEYAEVDEDGNISGANFAGPLQPVISAVQELNFIECDLLDSAGKRHAYSCTYEIVDEYDFDNDRSDQPAYDNYRKGLAALMRQDVLRQSMIWWPSINKFDIDAITILITGSIEEGITDKGRLIASLIYAAQKNGFYKGIPWRVKVPFSFTVETRSEIYPRIPDGVRQADQFRANILSTPASHARFEGPRILGKRARRHFIAPHPPLKNPIYIVAAGDTLSGIAKRFLGDASKWELIYKLNKGSIGLDPNLIRTGVKLRIPLF